MKINTILFDLGGVLIDWNPRYVFKEYFSDPQQMEWFFENICTWDWNEEQDAGYPLALATEEKLREHYPHWQEEIRAYYGRWEEMLGEPIAETVNILQSITQNPALRVLALTNWSAETFPVARRRFEFLSWFEGIVVSGEEKIRKPQPKIYQTVLDRYQVTAENTVFIDDNLRNCLAAEAMGFKIIHFQSPIQTQEALQQMGVL